LSGKEVYSDSAWESAAYSSWASHDDKSNLSVFVGS